MENCIELWQEHIKEYKVGHHSNIVGRKTSTYTSNHRFLVKQNSAQLMKYNLEKTNCTLICSKTFYNLRGCHFSRHLKSKSTETEVRKLIYL